MITQHLTLPSIHYSEIQAAHPAEDLVALKDSSGRDWIWYQGHAFYVSAEHLPGAQWVVDYAYKAMYFGGHRPLNDMDELVKKHAVYPHFANLASSTT